MPSDNIINSLVNINVPAQVPEAFQDAEVRAAVELTINSSNNILRALEQYLGITQKDITLWDFLIPSDTLLAHQLKRLYVTAGEDISFGHFVNLYNDGGVLKCRKAQGTAGNVRPARGFCSTSGGILTGERGEIIIGEGLLAVSGLNPGEAIYLSTTAGSPTITPLTGAGQLEQFLGFGVAGSLAYVDIAQGPYIQH